MRPYLIFLILLVLLAFANSLQNSFVWDDGKLIIQNPTIDLTLKQIPLLFTTPLWELAGYPEVRQPYYRPVVSLLFVLNYKIWGLNPAGFHLTNIFLHLLCVIALFQIGMLLFNDKSVSLIGAAIFAVHPIHNESVGRAASGEVIFGFFIILSLYCFLKEKKYISLLMFFLALLSKETAIMLPFALAILAVDKKGLRKGIIEIIPYILLIFVYLILRIASDTVFGEKVTQSPFVLLLTMATATLDYMRLLIIPYPLSPYYPSRWQISILEPKVMVAIAVLISTSFLAFKVRKNKIILFLLAFPFIFLAPVIWRVNTFPAAQDTAYIAERFLYVPAMTFSLFISAGAAKLNINRPKKYLALEWMILIIILIVITAVSNITWRDNLTLFKKITSESPDVAFAHNDLGVSFYKTGQLDNALKEYETAIRLAPNSETAIFAHLNIGAIYTSQGRLDKAVQEFETTLKLKPDYAKAYFNIGTIYALQGELDKALREYKTAIKLNPNSEVAISANLNIAAIYVSQGRLDEAVQEYKTVLKLKPDFNQVRRILEALQNKQPL